MTITDETEQEINSLISYYRHHSIDDFVRGGDKRLQGFVIDDFTKLLSLLEKAIDAA